MAVTITTIANTTLMGNFEARNTFYCNGRYWVFYKTNGRDWFFRTSTDGTTWSDATALTFTYQIQDTNLATWCDGTYLHYVTKYVSASYGNLYYRMGLLNSDGSITWQAAEQAIDAGISGFHYGSTRIVCDSNGYPWVCTVETTTVFNYYIVVWNSSTKNGTWTGVDTSAPSQLNYAPHLIPLPNGNMYIVYITTSGANGYLYSGSAWGTVEAIFNANNVGYVSAVANLSNDIYITYITTANYDIKFQRRRVATGLWDAATTIQTGNGNYPPYATYLCTNLANNNAYCFWISLPTTDHVYYKRYNAVSWDTDPTDWIDETTDDLGLQGVYYTGYQVSYSVTSGKIGFAYVTSNASPYNLRYAFLNITSGIDDRVGSIRHIYRPGVYKAELTLGGLSAGIDMPDLYVPSGKLSSLTEKKEDTVPEIPEGLKKATSSVTDTERAKGNAGPSSAFAFPNINVPYATMVEMQKAMLADQTLLQSKSKPELLWNVITSPVRTVWNKLFGGQ